jgi:Glycosyltransferases involved in cell wall biogenesis
MPTLTALVLTKNEEKMLPSCLARLQWADEILVIDSGSTDNTVMLAESAGARVVTHPFADFSSQSNFGLNEARSDWVLQIDADEMVTPELRDSVIALLRAGPANELYSVHRDAFVFGRHLRASSWSGEWIPRLFRKGSVEFSGLVHPQPNVNGRPVGRLDGILLHYTYRSTAQYFEKFQSYSTLWADNARAKGRRTSIPKACAAGAWRFFHNYFIRGEIRDGRIGFLLSVLGAMHTFIRHIKLWGLEHAEEISRVRDPEEE